jgi:hypothetical protein
MYAFCSIILVTTQVLLSHFPDSETVPIQHSRKKKKLKKETEQKICFTDYFS